MKESYHGRYRSQWFFQRPFRSTKRRDHSSQANESIRYVSERNSFRQKLKSIGREKEFHTIRRWKNRIKTAPSGAERVPEDSFGKTAVLSELRIISGDYTADGSCFDEGEESDTVTEYDYRDEPSLGDISIQNINNCELSYPATSHLEEKRQNLCQNKKKCTQLSRAAFALNSDDIENDQSLPSIIDSSAKSDFANSESNTCGEWHGTYTIKRLESSLLSMLKLGKNYPSEQNKNAARSPLDQSQPRQNAGTSMSMSSFSHVPTASLDPRIEENSPYGNHAKYFI